MSGPLVDMRDGAPVGADQLFARATAAETRARRGLTIALDDFFLSEDARLDERTRSALSHLLRALVETVESEIRGHGARLLATRGESELAESFTAEPPFVLAKLTEAGLLRDPELIGELLARVRQELIASAMAPQASEGPERPSLINRFALDSDRVLAAGAMAVLVSESRRRAVPDGGPLAQTDLPAELHHRLVWWAAAALRAHFAAEAESLPTLDRAIVEAAQRSLAAHDEGDRLEATSMRLAGAIDAQPPELALLLVESLGDRRVTLFTALLAHALGISYEIARDIVFDADADRLWLALRALDLSRETIARIGYALCEADPRRDLEAFADALDTIVAIDPTAARAALASLRLHPDYRAALQALERGGTR
jgi:hypothetical protein